MEEKQHIDQFNKGAISLMLLFSILLIIGLQSELAILLNHRSNSVKILRERIVEEENGFRELLHDNSGNSSNSIMKKIMISSSSVLNKKEYKSNFALPSPLFITHLNNPKILWRNFITGNIYDLECEGLGNQCQASLEGIYRSYSDINLYNLELKASNDNSVTALAALGSINVEGHIKAAKSASDKNDEAFFLILSAINDISINQFFNEDFHNITLIIYSARGKIILPGIIPPHDNCNTNLELNSPRKMKLYIAASSAYAGDTLLELYPYQNCLPTLYPHWFPEEKLVGFSRR